MKSQLWQIGSSINSPVVTRYLRLVLIKDTPWWLLSEVFSVAKKLHTSHSCSGWESGLCWRGVVRLLRKLAAALRRGTEIGSSWPRKFSLLWKPPLSSLSTTSPCIRSLSISHTTLYTASDSAQTPELTLLTGSLTSRSVLALHAGSAERWGFLLCHLSSPRATYWPLQHTDREGPGLLPALKLSLEVDQTKG